MDVLSATILGGDMCGSNIIFPTLMGSVGGWVFVVDVTRGVGREGGMLLVGSVGNENEYSVEDFYVGKVLRVFVQLEKIAAHTTRLRCTIAF